MPFIDKLISRAAARRAATVLAAKGGSPSPCHLPTTSPDHIRGRFTSILHSQGSGRQTLTRPASAAAEDWRRIPPGDRPCSDPRTDDMARRQPNFRALLETHKSTIWVRSVKAANALMMKFCPNSVQWDWASAGSGISVGWMDGCRGGCPVACGLWSQQSSVDLPGPDLGFGRAQLPAGGPCRHGVGSCSNSGAMVRTRSCRSMEVQASRAARQWLVRVRLEVARRARRTWVQPTA